MKKNNLKHNLSKNGWIVIKNFLSKKETLKYKKLIYFFLKKNHKSFKGRDINYADNTSSFNKINSFHKLEACKHVKNFFRKGKLFKASKYLLGNNTPELRASELFNKPKNCGLKAAPHQDGYYWNVKKNLGLTFWIALDKANKNNGSMYYYTGSHKVGLLAHKPSYGKGTSQVIKNKKELKKFKKQYLELNPGDAAVHTSLIVHGSDKNTSNYNRAGWTFAIKSKNHPYDKKRTDKFEKSLHKQIKLRKKNARI